MIGAKVYRFPGFELGEPEECDCEADGVECVCYEGPDLEYDVDAVDRAKFRL